VGYLRVICPDCEKHKQLDMRTVNALYSDGKGECDCKNLFEDENGNITGQCCCYSEEHLDD